MIQDGKVDRSDTSFADVTNFDYLQPAGVPTEDETHSGADVGIYALGKIHSFINHSSNHNAFNHSFNVEIFALGKIHSVIYESFVYS